MDDLTSVQKEKNGKRATGEPKHTNFQDHSNVSDSIQVLLNYCEKNDFRGYDPYDALNSPIISLITKPSKWLRIAAIQFFRRFPINLRPVFLVPRERNPKGIGLFALSYLKLYELTKKERYREQVENFLNWLLDNSCPGYSEYCWGYNFDWQSRAFFLPKGTPTVVNTAFVGRAFLKAYEVLGNEIYLNTARGACDFILTDLNIHESNNRICFSYSPVDTYFVHNATALASSLLASVFGKTGEERLFRTAKKSLRYVSNHQEGNGSWDYGESKTAQGVGVDNFHTGFILESLKIYTESTGDESFISVLKHGLDFYQNNFFLESGTPKYYCNEIYPIDIHSAAQAIVTLTQLKDYGADQTLCRKVVRWAIENMRDERGYFYYQKGRFFTNKIAYMRWNQAWMLYALTSMLDEETGRE